MAYTEATVLGILRSRLNRLPSDTSLDVVLKPRIAAADKELARKGISLVEDDEGDQVLLADYTAWMYQKRDDPGGMPQWLRLRIRERWLAQPRTESAT